MIAVLALAASRCNCDEGSEIGRASIEMSLVFMEVDSCSGTVVPRRIPDSYEETGRALATDLGSRAELAFELTSIGNAPLVIEAIELSPADDEFALEIVDAAGAVVDKWPASLAPNASAGLTIAVAYGSGDSDADAIELVVRTSDPKRSEVRFALTAGRGKLEVCTTASCGEDAALDFANTPIDAEKTERVVLKNVGDGALDLRSIVLESSSAEFCATGATAVPTGVPECPIVPHCLVLTPGETYAIDVRYRPVDGGPDEGAIIVASGDAAAGTVSIPLAGRGSGPAICPCIVDGANCTSAVAVDFGSAAVGSPVERTLRLVSCGTEPATVTEAVLEDDRTHPYFTGPEFVVVAPFRTGDLAPETTESAAEFSEGTIRYTPTQSGTNHGGLRYVTTHAPSRSWIVLGGRAATCDLEAVPSAISFGTVAGGETSDRTALLTNVGDLDCTVSRIGSPAAPFSIVNPPALPFVVSRGGDRALTVRYAPPLGATTTHSSSFDVTSNEVGPGSTQTIQLNGVGGGTPICEVTITPSGNDTFANRDGALQFGAVNIGYDKTLPARIENTGTSACVLESFRLVTTASGNQFTASSAQQTPATIGPGSSVNIDVTFAPTGPGPTPFGVYSGLRNYLAFSLSGASLAQTDFEISLSAFPTVPLIDVLPDRVDFGVVTWRDPRAPDNRSACGSAPRTVNIYNTGTGTLNIVSLEIDASSDPVFLIEAVRTSRSRLNPPYTNIRVASGESLGVDLRFYPTRANPADHQGLLVIDNDVTNPRGNGSPLTVPLRGTGTTNERQTDVFHQLRDNKVDILWVIDDSGSMGEEQRSLASNFSSFVGFADTLGVDYQIGVVTTEVVDAPAGLLWACSGYDKIIRSSDANRVAAFQCAANVTDPPGNSQRPNPGGSDEREAGLQAARMALDVPRRDAENAGFLRDDARLAVIVVSDEEDQSQGAVALYVDFFRQLKGWANPQLVSVSAIAGDLPNGCATADAGARYESAVSSLGGQFGSICSSSWASMLENIGLGVFSLRHAWTLSRPAEASTITVRVDGNFVAGDARNGWTFDEATNIVTFHGTSIPNTGATIEIQYGTRCLE